MQLFNEKNGPMGDILILSQPGVRYDGSEDGGEVAQSHENVIDGGGKVLLPEQEVLEVQHQHRCGTSSEAAQQIHTHTHTLEMKYSSSSNLACHSRRSARRTH